MKHCQDYFQNRRKLQKELKHDRIEFKPTLKDIKEHIFEYAWELLADSSFPIILQDENGKVIGKQG